MLVDAFVLTLAEKKHRSIRANGDSVLLRDPYRWRRVALLLFPIAVGAYETWGANSMMRRTRSTTRGKSAFPSNRRGGSMSNPVGACTRVEPLRERRAEVAAHGEQE